MAEEERTTDKRESLEDEEMVLSHLKCGRCGKKVPKEDMYKGCPKCGVKVFEMVWRPAKPIFGDLRVNPPI